jgi:hypothetical protein
VKGNYNGRGVKEKSSAVRVKRRAWIREIRSAKISSPS